MTLAELNGLLDATRTKERRLMEFQAALKGIKLDGQDTGMKPIEELDIWDKDGDNEKIELQKAGIGYIEG